MGSVNRVLIVGRLGKDPEMRATTGGKDVANFNVATDSGYGDNRHTEWHRVVAWDKQATNVGNFLKKGSQVAVEGRLQTRSWEQNGEKKFSTEIVATNVQFLSGKGDVKAEDSSLIGNPAKTQDNVPW